MTIEVPIGIEIKAEGNEAFRKGVPVTHNPYDKDHPVEHALWFLGWKTEEQKSKLNVGE